MLTVPSLRSLPGVRHAFFTREGGVSQGLYASLNGGIGSNDDPAHVAENRARMAQALRVAPDRFASLYQVHSPDVVIVEQTWSVEARPKADAMVTATRGLAIGVSTADCGPVLFADAKAGVVGAAHAGWRGALTGVLDATLGAMEALGANRDRIVAALGPMIHQDSYEVGAEFLAGFRARDPANVRFFKDAARADHFMFDLPGYIAARLRRAGLTRIEDIGLCTYADPARFYSYRRSVHRGEADYGRHVNAIALAD
jgi:YfiH family protein